MPPTPSEGRFLAPVHAPTVASAADQHGEPVFGQLDRTFRAGVAYWTGGLAPSAPIGAMTDWVTHLVVSPGKQLSLTVDLGRALNDNINFAWSCSFDTHRDPCRCALAQDNRFRADQWQRYPFNVLAYSFLSAERWWEAATTGVRGVSRRHEALATFLVRQTLDMIAPSNFAVTNPQVIEQARAECGANFIRGGLHWLEDVTRFVLGAGPAGMDAFKVGETVAATPGKVVHRTRLAEVIQYAPTTPEVRPEPIVIVPAWIMKYYVLDLSPANSLVRYLTDQGFTVFMISWKNPDREDRDTGFDDYRTEGLLPAIEAARTITGAPRVHAVGYCLGGTLLTAAAAAMARDHDDRLASISLFAAQADFTDAGELMLFVDDAQVDFLEDMMWQRGYLDTRQMAGAFQMLRSNDLIWSRVVYDYMIGRRSPPNDIMAWNADATRMPYRMHSEYLRSLFLDNDLAEGRFEIGGEPVAIEDILVPLFVVATEHDHVAPWRSVYKFHLLADAEISFVLTNGGHNAGILSEPGHKGRHYRVGTRRLGVPYVGPDRWWEDHEPVPGSWWSAWSRWLADRSGSPAAPPPLGLASGPFAAQYDAPGAYVRMK